MKRRSFLAMTAASAARVAGANERLRGAVIGSGGRGRFLTAQFKELGAEMAAVCDVYEPNLQAGLDQASPGAEGYHDYREMLQDGSLDFVIIATPDHWHARMAIDAVAAGKDVYLEKPMAHTIAEAFDIVKATRRTRRVVQIGTQRRSSPLFQAAQKLMPETGEVRLVTSQWLNYQASLRKRELKGKLDWKRWLGSAPKRPLDALRFFNWYYFWDYSGGLMVGQAAHIVDAINWFMDASFPLAVTCAAAPPQLEGAEVPETTSMAIEYPEGFLAIFTCGYRAMKYNPFHDQLKQFHGNRARLDVGREWYKLYPQSRELELKPSVKVERPGSFGGATVEHIRNFLACVKSREDPNATVEMGLWTTVTLCMAMEALRKGRRVTYDARKKQMIV